MINDAPLIHDTPMTGDDGRKRRGFIALLVATVGLGVPMALRGEVNLWLLSAVAGAVSLAAVIPAVKPRWSGVWPLEVREIALGCAVGAGMYLATWALFPPVGAAMPWVGADADALYRWLNESPGPVAALPVVCLLIVVEEVVWRGIAVDLLGTSRRTRTWSVATLLYAIPHLCSGSLLLIALALACGAVWTALRLMTGSISASTTSHLVWSLCAFVFFPLAPT